MSALLKADYLPHYSCEDYARWEGDWELIEGLPFAMSPAPNIRHQSLSVAITWKLAQQLKNCPDCQVLHDVDWKISEDTVVQPDNLIICPKASGQYLTRAPQLIVEILSPSTAHKDRTLKFDLYEREGVRWYLIVNPTDNVAHIFERIEGKYRKITDATQEVFSFTITDTCQVELDFSELWVE
jgi:Uma2 family endonuclease